MPVFTHTEVTQATPELIDSIFEFGKQCVIPEALESQMFPYPEKAAIQRQFDDGNRVLFIYADGVDLRVVVAFDSEGVIRFCVSKPWLTPAEIEAGNIHPNGRAQSKYYYDFIKAECGQVKSFNTTPHPSVKSLYEESGVIVIKPGA